VTGIYLDYNASGLVRPEVQDAMAKALVARFTAPTLQAITQVQEQTLSFVPKSLCVYGVLIILGPWLLNTMLQYMKHMLDNLPVYLIR